jgi:hypothetical protein
MIQEFPNTPQFRDEDLNTDAPGISAAMREDAVWDVFFVRLSGLQEYGFHAGIEKLMWATDQLDGSLSALDWPKLRQALATKSAEWTDMIIAHATDEGAFFPPVESSEESEDSEAL